ncbi:translation initiation factor IF-2 [Candidatus Mycoplasma haematominutum]|uniref:Translation initiation factor IF-2 n=1 Tax=Candidatus Mycoplasma haematominutum 'Birmingham 1' TaxID=1116213 RepID=G8C2W5_9MOLU|nr:translation initiation factor IF-2 [Candidatus Mycoplasma haematominutum]CCE66663.1 translation initiation factor 2 [Candidatus Mycoplasma haematominutum 'Birmingham 1']
MTEFKYQNKAVSVKYFSETTQIPPVEIIKYFFLRGKEMTLNSWLNEKYCRELCDEFGLKFLKEERERLSKFQLESELLSGRENNSVELVKKIPVVAVMGHVNHGKTTLLDRIRKTNVAEREYARITQHISSYQIKFKDAFITFLDTPGHEIFQKLRNIGGVIADVIVLVISIEDGVQSQTKEVIEYYKSNNLKLIIFVNKIDRGDHSIENLKQQLTGEGIELEEWGGDVLLVKGSAKTGAGVEELLDTIQLLAEMEEYCTTLSPPAIGIILESRMERGLGAIAEIITIRGTLTAGDYISGKKVYCKIKAILGEGREKITKLAPATPATISGFETLPPPGTRFFSFVSKEQALQNYRELGEGEDSFHFKEGSELAERENPTHFSFIVKSRVCGSSEAIQAFLGRFNYSVISMGAGEINETDLKQASIKKAIIINFEQKISRKIEDQLNFLNIPVWSIRSIYELEEKILDHIEKHRIVEKIEKILGRCKVIRLWSHSRIGTIAGCSVLSGKIQLNHKVKLIREGNLLTKTTIKSFKIETFEVKEALEGQECGIVLTNWNNVELDDVIESYEIIERKV